MRSGAPLHFGQIPAILGSITAVMLNVVGWKALERA
jgi:hypothetical protein